MGNNSSETGRKDLDSDEGGSDYEHAYDYHTSVLRKSPADGFESDYEDDDNFGGCNGRVKLLALPPPSPAVRSLRSSATTASSTSHGSVDNGNSQGVVAMTTPLQGSVGAGSQAVGVLGEQASLRAVQQASNSGQGTQSDQHGPSGDKKQGARSKEKTSLSSSGQSSAAENRVEVAARLTVQPTVLESKDVEDMYETAGEDVSGSEAGGDKPSDDDSLSTITPPRTRPQSDSELSRSTESEEEEEEDDSSPSATSASDTVTENVSLQSSSWKSPASQSRTFVLTPPSASARPQQRLPRRERMSPEAYRYARKRAAEPTRGGPAKRIKAGEGVNMSPNRTRFGLPDSESESDVPVHTTRRSSRIVAPVSSHQRTALSARGLRQAAKRAASQFVETSRKILQDARAAARMLKESAGSKRRSSILDGGDAAGGKRKSPGKREMRSEAGTGRMEAEFRREERLNQAGPSATGSQSRSPRSRRSVGKRKAGDAFTCPGGDGNWNHWQGDEDGSDFSVEDTVGSASLIQIRKDGGRRRKFTQSQSTTSTTTVRHSVHQSPSSESVNIRSNSQALYSGTGGVGSSTVRARGTPPKASTTSINTGGVGSSSTVRARGTPPKASATSINNTSSTNPFQNVTLLPTSPQLNTSTGSTDSIGPEVSGSLAGYFHSVSSPFTSLNSDRTETPPPAAFGSGSVWARINTGANKRLSAGQTGSVPTSVQAGVAPGSQPLPPSGPSSSRRATRTSPRTIVTTPSPAAYPVRTIPRVPSLTLTGQFAQSARFAFLLEDTLQVTVTTTSMTMASTSGVVVCTDSQLRHESPGAQSVASAAGAGFTPACQQFLRHNKTGLQVCQVLDAPAGGHLSPLIGHVLLVVVPQTDSPGPSDAAQHRKLLLSTYLNCLKHAAHTLAISSLAFPLLGAESSSADECIQVFFDSLLVYLAERTPTCPLHAIHLSVSNAAVGRFAAEVLEARLETLRRTSVDDAMATVFRSYFNIPDFSRNCSLGGASSPGASQKSPSGKPAVKRRRL